MEAGTGLLEMKKTLNLWELVDIWIIMKGFDLIFY